jgi:hypothetical protein
MPPLVGEQRTGRENAQRLGEVVAAGMRALPELDDEDGSRTRRADAMEQIARYVQLLGEATQGQAPIRFRLKLEFPDGRWDLIEQELPKEPRAGDLVWVDQAPWQVVGHQLVNPRPSQKPAYHVFACAPAA